MTQQEFDHARQITMQQYLTDSSTDSEVANRLLDLWAWLQSNWRPATFGDFFEKFAWRAQPVVERKALEDEFHAFMKQCGSEPTFADLRDWNNSHKGGHGE